MSVRNLIRRSGVTLICTTDDPADSLYWHKELAADDSFDVQVLPVWRPDKAMNIEKPDYAEYLKKLGQAARCQIETFADLKMALKKRMDAFEEMGCRASDHALEYVMYVPETEENLEKIFAKRKQGEMLTKEEELKFKTAFMGICSRGVYKEKLGNAASLWM